MRLSALRADLDAALAGAQHDLAHNSYTAFKVLLLNWELQDLGHSNFDETAELEAVFRGLYSFTTETYRIPGELTGASIYIKILEVLWK